MLGVRLALEQHHRRVVSVNHAGVEVAHSTDRQPKTVLLEEAECVVLQDYLAWLAPRAPCPVLQCTNRQLAARCLRAQAHYCQRFPPTHVMLVGDPYHDTGHGCEHRGYVARVGLQQRRKSDLRRWQAPNRVEYDVGIRCLADADRDRGQWLVPRSFARSLRSGAR
jgi:hypothetical protein